jgi:hypothetical protein
MNYDNHNNSDYVGNELLLSHIPLRTTNTILKNRQRLLSVFNTCNNNGHRTFSITHDNMKQKSQYNGHVKTMIHILKLAFKYLYENLVFSTFPYIVYKMSSSIQALKQFRSGNCIAMASFLKRYLRTNFGISSYIIGASVPDWFKVENTPYICHCALCIPLGYDYVAIMDGAFYMKEPIVVKLGDPSFKDNMSTLVPCSDIYTKGEMNIEYRVETGKENQFMMIEDINYTTENRNKLENCHRIHCKFEGSMPQQTWEYFLIEVKNPDESIGQYFLREKPLPFMLYTEFEPCSFQNNLKYKVYVDDTGDLQIKDYSTEYGATIKSPEKVNAILTNLSRRGYFDDNI